MNTLINRRGTVLRLALLLSLLVLALAKPQPAHAASSADLDIGLPYGYVVCAIPLPDAGENGNCSILVGNRGHDPAPFIVTTVDLEGPFGNLEAPSHCEISATSPEVSCLHPEPLAAGDSIGVLNMHFGFAADVPEGTPVKMTFSVATANDPNPANNTRTLEYTVGRHIDLAVTNTCTPADPATVVPGTTYECTMTVTNGGPSDAADVLLTGNIPSHGVGAFPVLPQGQEVTVASAPGCLLSPDNPEVVCALGTVPPGATVTRTLTARLPAGAPTATILATVAKVSSSTSDDRFAEDNTSVFEVEVGPPEADVGVEKWCGAGPVLPGDVLTCTLWVSQFGPSDAPNVVLADNLPDGLTLIGAPAGVGFSCQTKDADPEITCTRAVLPAGQNAMVTYQVQVAADTPIGTVLVNTAAVSAAALDHFPGQNSQARALKVDINAEDIIEKVDSYDLPDGLDQALNTKLEKALEAIQTGDTATACSELNAFKNLVQAQAGKKLSAEQAAELLAYADLLMTKVGCK